MKYASLILFLLTSAFMVSGCLVFHKMSYEIELETDKKGKATVNFYDILSDSRDTTDLAQDKESLFTFAMKSEEFIKGMQDEGKIITFRELYVNGDTLNATVNLTFEDITRIENITYEDGFYYLTLSNEDSVISTNGQMIKSKDYKRILWDSSIKTLKFSMLGFEKRANEFITLAPYLKQYK